MGLTLALHRDGMSHCPSAFPVRETASGAVRNNLASAADPPLGKVSTKKPFDITLMNEGVVEM